MSLAIPINYRQVFVATAPLPDLVSYSRTRCRLRYCRLQEAQQTRRHRMLFRIELLLFVVETCSEVAPVAALLAGPWAWLGYPTGAGATSSCNFLKQNCHPKSPLFQEPRTTTEQLRCWLNGCPIVHLEMIWCRSGEMR